MPYLTLTPNTTCCQDTPENWRAFQKLKDDIAAGVSRSGDLQKRLDSQISRENKHLRSLRTYLPGHEPDR